MNNRVKTAIGLLPGPSVIVQQDSTYRIYNTVTVANDFLPTAGGISVCGEFYVKHHCKAYLSSSI